MKNDDVTQLLNILDNLIQEMKLQCLYAMIEMEAKRGDRKLFHFGIFVQMFIVTSHFFVVT